MSPRSALSSLVFTVLIALSLPSYAQFTFAPINVPGAVATEARGINNNGEIVGFYKTTACTDYDIKVPACPVKGFKYVNSKFIKLMVPGSTSTAILGVNDWGDLVGFYTKSDGSKHGFIWYHQNVVKTIDYPNPPANTSTVAFGINKAGMVVGGLWVINPSFGTFPDGGWVWVNGKFSNMDPFNHSDAGPCCWSVNSISNNGIIAGQVFQADFNQAWLKEATDEDFYMDVAPGNGGGDTFGTGLNSATDIVGYGYRGWFAKNIEQNEGTNDSTEQQPKFMPVTYPGASITIPFGLNDARAVVGTYSDSKGMHGFLAKANF